MKPYHKIPTVYLRDPENKHKTLLEGEFSMPEFAYLKNCKWQFTEKVDGTNIRVKIDNGEISFAGRTDRAEIPNDLNESLKEIFYPKRKLIAQFFNTVCFYGEGYGLKIGKNGPFYSDEHGFALFDIYLPDSNIWLKDLAVLDLAIKLDLEVVPIIGEGTLDEMIKRAKQGFMSAWGDFVAEGIVARPKEPLFDRLGKRIITKVKHKDFV